MSKITETFKQLKSDGKKGLVVFVMCGDPDVDSMVDILNEVANAGADVIELGIPFSDPTADGPVIQAAAERALAKGTSVQHAIQVVSEFRKNNSETPVLLFGYLNPVWNMGVDQFIRKSEEAGVDGYLCVDLPAGVDPVTEKKFLDSNLDLISLIAPTTGQSRLEEVVQRAQGFLYTVSVAGVTGGSVGGRGDIERMVKDVKALSEIPVAVGFGIDSPEKAAEIARFSDAVVVGSALIREIEDSGGTSLLLPRVGEFVKQLREGIDQVQG
jgi:tryptophan synthase alpha chain